VIAWSAPAKDAREPEQVGVLDLLAAVLFPWAAAPPAELCCAAASRSDAPAPWRIGPCDRIERESEPEAGQ